MKNKTYHTAGTVPKSNRKKVEKGKSMIYNIFFVPPCMEILICSKSVQMYSQRIFVLTTQDISSRQVHFVLFLEVKTIQNSKHFHNVTLL